MSLNALWEVLDFVFVLEPRAIILVDVLNDHRKRNLSLYRAHCIGVGNWLKPRLVHLFLSKADSFI